MTIPAVVRDLLACPRCHGPLVEVPPAPASSAGPEALGCRACALAFPVEQGIPVLLVERATPWPAR